MSKLLGKAITFTVLFAALSPRLFACSKPPGFGFIILSILRDETGPFPVDSPIPSQTLTGDFASADSTTQGDRTEFVGSTRGDGTLVAEGKATPATWRITYNTGACSSIDPIRVGPSQFLQHFVPTSDPQKIICIQLPVAGDNISASPGSFDTSVTTQASLTMTDVSQEWQRNPASFVNYDAYGNVIQTGSVQVQDSYNCWGSFIATYTGSTTQYIWLVDANGKGIGYTQISVINGSGGGG